MKEFKIKEDLLTAVVQFVSSRPINEAVGLWDALKRLEPIEPANQNRGVEMDSLKKTTTIGNDSLKMGKLAESKTG